MNRPPHLIVRQVSWAFPGFLFLLLGIASDVQAVTVTDTFELKVTLKEWCRGNPRFFENIKTKVTDGVTLTITRDPQSTGDTTAIQATINNTGNADVDAMTLNGLGFPSNSSGTTAQFILLGTLNNGHFLSIRGQANVDKLGNLTKVTGTIMYEITGTYTIDKSGTQSQPVDCFGSGTLVTGKKF
jgi:hypothetical protein